MKKRVRFNISPIIILFFLIFAVFMYFRFSNFHNRIAFGWDQEQFSFQVRRLVIEHKPILIGPRISNDRGFFLGPYFSYMLVPFYLITNLHPNALALFLIVYSLLFFFGTYFILKYLFNQYIALLFLAFWSINPLTVRYDSVAWNPSLIPLSILITWMLLKKIYDHNHIITLLLLGSSIGFFMHLHVQFAFIIVFVCIGLFMIRKQSKPDIIRIALLILPILLSFIPLILFDFRHGFLNFNAIRGFLTQGIQDKKPSITEWIPVFQNVIQPITVIKSSIITVIFYFTFLAVQLFLLTSKKGFIKLFYSASAALWILFPMVFAKYGQRPSEYYFLFLYPFIYITIADFFYSIKKIFLLSIILFLLLIINFKAIQFNLKTDYYSLKYKDALVRKLAQRMKEKVFNLSYATTLTTDYGFRYLVDYYQLKPTGNWKDPLVQIKIPADNQCSIKVAEMGVIIPKELSY